MIEPCASVTVSDPWPGRIHAGAPFIEEGEWPEVPADSSPGDLWRLQTQDGLPIGLGVFDPANKLIRTIPTDHEKLDAPFFQQRLQAARRLRIQSGVTSSSEAYRLVNSEGDNLSGFVVDVYGPHVVVYTYSDAFERYLPSLAEAIENELPVVESIICKVRPPGETPSGKAPHQELTPSSPPRQFEVAEHGVKYEVHLLGGLNTGLFSDMRDVRAALRPHFKGKRVLNTFAYTGSFSVVAAAAGAGSVTTVDFASGVLNWAKKNFTLNGLSADDSAYRFVRADVFEYLKESRRKSERFDVVILDPPAATAVPGRRWFLKSDYDRLIAHALALLAPGGLLVVAASSHQSRPDQLDKQIRQAAQQRTRRLRLLQSFGLPADFPTQMIHPQGRYLKCQFLIAD